MRCEVLRPFQATNDLWLEIGPPGAPNIVNTDDWREESVLRLITQRYLRQVFDSMPQPEVAQTTPVPSMDAQGRFPRHGRRA